MASRSAEEDKGLAPITMEIEQPQEGGAVAVPVTIQNLSAGILTVQSALPIGTPRVGGFNGHKVTLRLPPAGPEETLGILEVHGVVNWVKQSTNGQRLLWLGMELTDLSPGVREALEQRIAHTPTDIRVLWQRWDELKVEESRLVSFLTGRGLSWLAAGLAGAGLTCLVLPPLAAYRTWGVVILVSAGFVGLVRLFTGRFPKRFELPG